MSKQQLVEFISQKTGMTKTASAEALDAVLVGISTGVKKDGKVTLVGFGTFECKKRAAREGRNPRTGETVKIASRNAIVFKAGSKLKEEIN